MFDDNECPLCIAPFPENEKWFKPCPCGFRVCVWCWNQMFEVAAESETAKVAKCPGCREPLDKDVLAKQKPKNSSHSHGHDKQRPPRRAHPSKTALSDMVINDGHNVVIRGLPSELFTLYSTTNRSGGTSSTQQASSSASGTTSSSQSNNNNSNNTSNQHQQQMSLQELVCSQQWFGQYGRIMSCVASQVAGAIVIRFFNADDAQNLVNAMNNQSATTTETKIMKKVFVASILEEEEEEEEAENDVDTTTSSKHKKQQRRQLSSSFRSKKDLVLSCGPNLTAAIVPTRYCSSFLRNEECKRPFCVELHHQSPSLQKTCVIKGQRASETSVYGGSMITTMNNNTNTNTNNNTTSDDRSEHITTTEDGIDYYSIPKDWTQDLLGALKNNTPQYFSSGCNVVQANLERKIRMTFDIALLVLNNSNNNKNNKNTTKNNLTFYQKRAMQHLPLVFPVLPPAAKEEKY